MKVYLAGPIANSTDGECNDWRQDLKDQFPEVEFLDPMVRDYREGHLGNEATIVEGDKADIDSVDLVFANCWKTSVGTSQEILYAWMKGKTVITLVPSLETSSPWIRYHSTVVSEYWGEALDKLNDYFIEYRRGGLNLNRVVRVLQGERHESVKLTNVLNNPAEESVNQEAHRLVHGDRGGVYGHPLDDFNKTAKLWSVVLGSPVTAEQVALCMLQVKVSRLLNTPQHRDSVVDIAGYAECYQMVVEERNRRESNV